MTEDKDHGPPNCLNPNCLPVHFAAAKVKEANSERGDRWALSGEHKAKKAPAAMLDAG